LTVNSKPTYQVLEGWEQLPSGFEHKDVSDVAVDSYDRVYLLTRSEPRVIVYSRDGRFLRSWGEGTFSARPHGITIGPDDAVYIVDEGNNSVRRYSTDGALELEIGPDGRASDTGVDHSIGHLYERIDSIRRAAGPYNKPTKVGVAPNGDLYVSDGYGNARVHHFDAQGKLLGSWGEPGAGPGQFHLPHSVAVAPDGHVLVADRENGRVQIFTPAGEFVTEWKGFHRPAGLCLRDGMVYVTELSRRPGYMSWASPKIGKLDPARVTVLDLAGNILARWGGEPSCAPTNFAAPHGVAVDSLGDVYVAEVTFSDLVSHGLARDNCHTFLKLERVPRDSVASVDVDMPLQR
jgi:DNA-binding beta-propeller fold protein YncE